MLETGKGSVEAWCVKSSSKGSEKKHAEGCCIGKNQVLDPRGGQPRSGGVERVGILDVINSRGLRQKRFTAGLRGAGRSDSDWDWKNLEE